jgi:hypothetical protein
MYTNSYKYNKEQFKKNKALAEHCYQTMLKPHAGHIVIYLKTGFDIKRVSRTIRRITNKHGIHKYAYMFKVECSFIGKVLCPHLHLHVILDADVLKSMTCLERIS